MIKQFYISKQDNEGDERRPNRKISGRIGEKEFKDIGAGWVKTDKNGQLFISCQLNEARTYKNQEGVEVKVEAFVIISEDEYNILKACEKRISHLTSPTEQFPAGIDMAKHPLNSPEEEQNYQKDLGDMW